jgi:hypothetical protein
MTTTDAGTRTAIVTASDSGIGQGDRHRAGAGRLDVGITWHADEQGAGTAEEVRALGRRAEVRRLDLEQLPEAADVSTSWPTRWAGGCGRW